MAGTGGIRLLPLGPAERPGLQCLALWPHPHVCVLGQLGLMPVPWLSLARQAGRGSAEWLQGLGRCTCGPRCGHSVCWV